MGYDASVNVVGIRPPDAEWEKMKAVWDSCEEAGIEVPKKVEDYFGGEGKAPHEEGLCVKVEAEICHSDDERMCLDINCNRGSYMLIEMAQLPANITHLKVWIRTSY